MKDLSFVKVHLDTASIEVFKDKFSNINEPLSRCVIVRAFNDMAKDKKCDSSFFINLASLIFREESDVVFVSWQKSIYSYTYDMVNVYLEKWAVGEEETQVKAALFNHFYQRAISEGIPSPTAIESMANYSADPECLKTILELYEKFPESFSISKVYQLVQMILGFGYGKEIDEQTVTKLVARAEAEDKTEGLGIAKQQFEILRLNRADRLAHLKKYLLNQGQTFSVAHVESFVDVFTSKYLPRDLLDEYLPTLFEHLPQAFKNNDNMYSRVDSSNVRG